MRSGSGPDGPILTRGEGIFPPSETFNKAPRGIPFQRNPEMAHLKDSNRTSFVSHSIDLHVQEKNLLRLSPDQALAHLQLLREMTASLFHLLQNRLPQEGGKNDRLCDYLVKIEKTLALFVLKQRIAQKSPNRDIDLGCTIDPSDSGFPIFVRDFRFLTTDKAGGEKQLSVLPGNDQLVDDALFMLFRGIFPRDVVAAKLSRNYYGTLLDFDPPEELKIYPETVIRSENGDRYCTQSFERFDDHSNIPRFYTLYLKIPSLSFHRPERHADIGTAIRNGLSAVANMELGFLADRIEAVEGVQLECLERYDIGPFYNPYTENRGPIKKLIQDPEDCILFYRKTMVVRTGEHPHSGIADKFKGWLTGDDRFGEFSPAIASPQYILMPHRLIQRAHGRDIDIPNARMFGVSKTGEIHD